MNTNTLASRVRSIGRGFAVGAGAGAAAGMAAFGYGLWEKNQFVLREETLAILPPGRDPFRILHLSDIHFVPGQKKKADWLGSLADLRPDLVVNTGDNMSHLKAVEPVLEALRPLVEPAPVAFDETFRGPPLPANAADADACLREARGLAQRMDIPVGGAVDFWTEAALFSKAGCATFVYGPGDIAQAHSADEWVALDELETAASTYLRITEKSS